MIRYPVYKRFRPRRSCMYSSKRDMPFNMWTLYYGDDVHRLYHKIMDYIDCKELCFMDIEKNYKKQVNDFMMFIYENSDKRNLHN